ncbi:hypothetical protein Celaphus_00009627, partial [Cervus elaphus hippelaphus]
MFLPSGVPMRHLQPHLPHPLLESLQQGTPTMSPRYKCGFRGGFGEVVGPTQEPRSRFPRQPTPQGPIPAGANEKGNNAVLGLSFPRNLWMILENAAFISVHRNDEADMVVIEADLFQTEVLQHRGMDTIFKTASKRKCNPRRTAQPATGTTATPKKKKQAVCTEEADKQVQKGTSTVHGTLSQHSFVFCGLWFMGSGARGPRSSHLLSEWACPSGEGPSSNAMSVPPVTARRDGTGELPKSSPRYKDYDSAMTLYNTYDSIIRGAVFVVAQTRPLRQRRSRRRTQITTILSLSPPGQTPRVIYSASGYGCPACVLPPALGIMQS